MIEDLIFNENLFLIILGIVWIIGAVLQDLKRREVDNIWNFSLIVFALGYRAFVSVWLSDYRFFLNGLIGFGIFVLLGNLFYYSRLFAGGDAKLLMALGAIFPLSYSWLINVKIFGFFVLLFLVGGSVYALIYSLVLVFINFNDFRKEYFKGIKVHKNLFLIGFVFFIFWVLLSFFTSMRFIFIGIIILLFPVLFVFARAVEESCLVKSVNPREVTLGDWLYKDIFINRKKIKTSWEGVTKKQLALIKKSRKNILIKYGIPFTPSFLISFLGLLFLIWRYGGFF